MTHRSSILAVAIFAAALPLSAAPVTQRVPMTRELPIYLGGTFVLENQAGDIEVIGSDDEKVGINAVLNVRAVDKDAAADAVRSTQVAFLGNPAMQIVRTLIPPIHNGSWTSGVNFVIHVPRTVHVKIVSTSAARIHVSDIRGNVAIKSFNGIIELEQLTGASTIETANGSIVFTVPPVGLAETQLSSVNGNVEVIAPSTANFQWIASTLKGDVRTTFPIRAIFDGNSFHGNINAPGGPTITTRSLMGDVAVLQAGSKYAWAKSLRKPDEVVPTPQTTQALPNKVSTFRQNVVQGFLTFSTLVGNILVGEIHGGAKLMTGAGEVQVGSILGNCDITSLGGPLNLGDMLGDLSARTEAGDVLVQSARNGGSITTGGGIIRLLYTGGPTRLQSGGGDIVVRQAAGPINAETQSGDITITIDPSLTKDRVTAKTAKGNIMIDIPPTFGADIDATVVTSEPDAQKFISDFPGLSIRREQIAGKTKIRATGKVNGGGERFDLYAQDGSIQLTLRTNPTVSVVKP